MIKTPSVPQQKQPSQSGTLILPSIRMAPQLQELERSCISMTILRDMKPSDPKEQHSPVPSRKSAPPSSSLLIGSTTTVSPPPDPSSSPIASLYAVRSKGMTRALPPSDLASTSAKPQWAFSGSQATVASLAMRWQTRLPMKPEQSADPAETPGHYPNNQDAHRRPSMSSSVFPHQ